MEILKKTIVIAALAILLFFLFKIFIREKAIIDEGIYVTCKINNYYFIKDGVTFKNTIYLNNQKMNCEHGYNGDLLAKKNLFNRYFLVRINLKNPCFAKVLLRYELNEKIAKQIDTGVTEIREVLLLPGVKIHEEIVNFDDGL